MAVTIFLLTGSIIVSTKRRIDSYDSPISNMLFLTFLIEAGWIPIQKVGFNLGLTHQT
jgi:hypothetical protein